ncbi:RNA polymerase, sigma 54 subunit, RpoN/SigL [Prevotellaceae bacterium HUN156]|jgi:RNA polymerase sigma-54 factor|nr:RNA polymerase, sigma 54 subunit, RpoN/SigL [Prevotellaceae bacterium HUN156]
MAQEQIQEQRLTQQQKLAQTITQQQLLQAQLIELPITQLMERVTAEMDDNPALEVSTDEPEYPEYADSTDSSDTPESSSDTYEQEERQSALDEALESIGRDDEELPVYQGGMSSQEEREDMVYGQSLSFYDQLNEQMNMCDLTEQERNIMEYLIGSLDDDGLLRKPLHSISDELAIYHNVDVTEQEIEEVLIKLQDFDPAGIGARSLQECLLLQIQRRDPSHLKDLMERTIKDYFELFTKKHWDKLQQVLQLTDLQNETLIKELRKLNPKPGTSMGEVVGHSIQQITPDFIVDTQDDGTVTFSLNAGDIPELHVSQSFTDTLNEYQTNKENMSRQMKEALLYTKKKVEAAQGFIEAIRVRRHTLTITMRAIIQWQHRFFEDGDEASLRPMILRDIAEKTGLALSTISRVSNSKYAQTRWGTFPLRYFFSDGYVTAEGEELSTRKIKTALRDLIDAEDKRKPLSDDALKDLLAAKGFPIARRTVAKYREQLGIPVARLRK